MLSVALDINGDESARRWHEQQHCTFKTLLDRENILAGQYKFRFVPNAFFYDEKGVILAKQVLFWINNPRHYFLLEQFVIGTLPQLDRIEYDATVPNINLFSQALTEREQIRFEQLLKLGVSLIATGEKLQAAKKWREALSMDPTNYALRCQIWGLEYPEKFYPQIDVQWQEAQLQRELSLEGSFCGKSGCCIALEQNTNRVGDN